MGITTEQFFENIYSVIFSPKAFFEREDIITSVRLGLATVIFIAFLNKIISGVFDGSIFELSFIFLLIWNICITVLFWFLSSLFFEYIAKIFNQGGNLSKLLFYSAFVPVPYMFFAPLNLVKQIGQIGYIFAAVIELLLYFWIIILYAMALKSVYKLTFSRAFMLIFLPFISSFIALYWIVGFFGKMCYIFSM